MAPLNHGHVRSRLVMGPIWFLFWSVLLSLTWLVRPHMPPWRGFPADAWVALITLIGATAVVVRTRGSVSWHPVTCLIAFLVALPWLQLAAGLLPYAGQAWMSSTYLLGFLLALLVGACWEQASPRQLAHALFGAICLAGVASVGLQLYGWLGLNESGYLGVWAVTPVGNRPAANLAQPNQLATLLVWSSLGCLWAYSQKQFGGFCALIVASFLLFGLAMTQSRAGMLAITCVLLNLWFWKRVWPSRHVPWAATGLYILFIGYLIALPWIDQALLLSENSFLYRHNQPADIRLQAWRLFSQAIIERPIFGYGWTEVSAAQLAVAEQFPTLGGLFTQSHNLLIDLFLWCGVPLGGFVVAMLVHWLWSTFWGIRHAEEAILFMLVTAVGIHALVEFPLKYAYFLLPTGLVMGILNIRLKARVVQSMPRWGLVGLVMTGALAVGVTVRDYAYIDSSYSNFRLDKSLLGKGREPLGRPPDVYALTHMREWIRLDHYVPHAGMDERSLSELETATYAFPSPYMAFRVAKAMALNGRPETAKLWLVRVCKFVPEQECLLLRKSWEAESRNDALLASIAWPEH